jgi:hypothetical protein
MPTMESSRYEGDAREQAWQAARFPRDGFGWPPCIHGTRDWVRKTREMSCGILAIA